ncbi:hypothetical protein N7486_003283 [Penicillium sp. IBT 16267x]|nr:hypothetical protein N7486_003283 [Penicillium sp. IBT 16267x]
MDSSAVSWNGEKVVLRTDSQWQPWYAAIRRYAKSLKVWDYCNPEIPRMDHLEPPKEPDMPDPPQFEPGDATGVALRTLREEFKEEKAAWRDDMEIYKLSMTKQQKIEKGMQLIDQALIVSVDIKLQQLMDRLETPYERLRFLLKRFSHVQSRKMDVIMKWKREEVAGPKRGQSVLQWLEEWDLLREEVLSLGLESDNLHPYAFLESVKDIMPFWWEIRYQQIVLEDTARRTEDARRCGKNSNSRPAFATSTWQGYPEAKPTKSKKFVPFQDRQGCPCGGRGHTAVMCWTLNEAIRPNDWEPYRNRLDAIKAAFDKEPEWKTWIEAKISEMSKDETSKEKVVNHTTPRIAFATALSTIEAHHHDQWVLDSGASVHVCNDRSRFTKVRECISSLRTGDSQTPTIGVGTAVMDGVNPITGEMYEVALSNCLLAPTFHCNLVSLGRLEELGAWWDMRKGHIVRGGEPILKTYREGDIYLFTQPDAKDRGFSAEKIVDREVGYATRKSVKPQISAATAETWHRRLGHVYQGAIRHLPELVNGVEIKPGEEQPDGPDSKLCEMTMGYNQHSWITHFYVEGIRFHWCMTHINKNGCQDAIRSFIAFAIKWLQLPIKVWHSDNEKTVDDRIHKILDDMGFVHTFTVPYSPEMNGPGERSGGMLTLRARALIKEGKLPDKLWPEAIPTAVYLLNRTPTRLEDGKWIVPWEEARQFVDQAELPRTSLANIRLYGSLAYCRIPNLPRLDKMRSRAEVGYLVGYVASNIWRIWMPHRGQVRMVRDAVFDESRRFSAENLPDEPVKMPLPQDLQPTIIEDGKEVESILQGLIEHVGDIGSTNDALGLSPAAGGADDAQGPAKDMLDAPQPTDGDSSEPKEIQDLDYTNGREKDPYGHGSTSRTPPRSPGSVSAADQGVGMEEDGYGGDLTPETPVSLPEMRSQTQSDSDVAEDVVEDVDRAALDIGNIVEGPRMRRPRRDEDFAYRTTTSADDDTTSVTLQAFATGLFAPKPSHRQHRDDLPPPPERFRDVWKHPLSDGFSKAMRVELDALQAKETYQEVEMPKDRAIQVLPLMWVYAYKFDQDGFLVKCKARICVRGDLQSISAEEKRAATLAARTARTMFALCAAYDLDIRQRDAVNAFLNSKLRAQVYTKMPEGFDTQGRCWLLLRALYGLRIAPRLWQKDATRVLRDLGLEQVAEDPCVFVGEGIIVFFYVDDILIASHRMARERARLLEKELEKHWQLTDQGDAEWFLGIRILRNRAEQKLWLVQDSYLTSVAERYNLTGRAQVLTPGTVDKLEPFEGQATPQSIHNYQQKVGSVQYGTTITRPDAAKQASILAQFLQNPGPKHHTAIDRLICYLYTTRYWAIQYGPVEGDSEVVKISSDASYGDNGDRTSSAGYMCQIFSGPVDWKATRQRTVTTSTTEAELLGLSDAGKALQWWYRLFRRIGFEYPEKLTIECDNARTVDLINAEDTPFDTKLRHVDIHGHWLRQEVREGRIRIRWVPTGQMVADGLTKVLPRQKHEAFVKMLGLVDVEHLIVE